MNKNLIVLIVAAAGAIFCGAAWFLPTLLQDARSAVEAEASVELERARRILDGYDATLVYRTALADRLAGQGIVPDPDEMSEETEDAFQQIHTGLWQSFQPVDWPKTGEPRRAEARYADIPHLIRTGLMEAAKLVGQNEVRLDDAEAAVDRALSITIGDESSGSHAEATRLKASIVYQMGFSRLTEAQLMRTDCDQLRRTIAALASKVAEAQATGSLVESSGIDEHTEAIRTAMQEMSRNLADDRAALAALDATMNDQEARYLAVDARAQQALRALAQATTDGIDLGDPNGARRFETAVVEQDRIHRRAAREAHALMFGDYPLARIEPSADYLGGRYVEMSHPSRVTIEHGLTHDHREWAVLAARIDRCEQGVTALRNEIARLEQVKRGYQAADEHARQRAEAAVSEALEVYEGLSLVESEAYVLEDEALGLFEESARIANQAARYADQWITDARDRTRGLSTEAQQQSPFGAGNRQADRWMGGFIAALEADARLAMATIAYSRYRDAKSSAALFAKAADRLRLREASADAEQSKAEEALRTGVTEIAAAMRVLETVYGQVNRHWTVTAQAATANDFLALFGQEGYATDALAAYRAAVQGRESQGFVEPFLARIARLENR